MACQSHFRALNVTTKCGVQGPATRGLNTFKPVACAAGGCRTLDISGPVRHHGECPFLRTSAAPGRRKGQENPKRLILIREPRKGPPCMEVVLLHGLMGTSHDTWTWDAPVPWKKFFWPEEGIDGDEDLQLARVWAYGYDADVFKRLFESSTAGIPDFAHNLLFELKSASADGTGPVIFLAHSMGGLVAKQAYLNGTTQGQYKSISDRVCGFLFLGTPHKGSDFADTLSKLLRLLKPESNPMVESLHPNSEALSELNDRFKEHISDHPLQNLHIFSLYETKPMALLNKLVVECTSATLGIDGESRIAMMTDHRDLVRFRNRKDEGLTYILDCLRMFIRKDGPWGPSVSMLPAKEKKKHLYDWLGTQNLDGGAMPYFLDRSAPGTCDWIKSHPVFEKWMDDKEATPNTLWIRGVQGTGKSVMASFISHLIENERPCTFSFQQQGAPHQSLHSLLGSLAFQLAHRSRRFCNHLVELAKIGERLNLYHDEWSLWATVFLHEFRQFAAEYKKPIYWVIDGLDMCASPDVLIGGLNFLSETPVPLKIIILTQWTGVIESQYRKLQCRKDVIGLGETPAVRNALEKYVKGELGCSRSEASEITAWAHGNFFLANLFITHARQARHTSLRTIMETVEPDDGIVGAVVSSIAEEWTTDEVEAAKNILQCAAYSKSALTVGQISECLPLMGIEGFSGDDIERLCGQLVTIDEHRRVQFQHTPIRSFLRRKGIRGFYLGPEESHEKLLTLCLQTFQKVDTASPGRLHKPGSFQDYALTSWTRHLSEITSPTGILPILGGFLNNRGVDSWICLLAEVKLLDLAISASAALALFRRKLSGENRGKNLDHQLVGWAGELPAIIGRFSGSLLKYPRAISELVPPFCPGNSLLSERGRTYGPDPIVVRGIAETWWDDTLARIPVPRPSSMIIRSHSHIAVACVDQVFLFSTSTFANVQTYSHEERIQMIRFSSCGEMLAVFGIRSLKVSKIEMTRHWSFTTPPRIDFMDMAFTSGNQNVLACAEWGDIWKYPLTEDCGEGAVIGCVRHKDGGPTHGRIRSAVFDRTGTLLATACDNLPISVWTLDLSASEPVSRPCRQTTSRCRPGKPHNTRVQQLDWIPNSTRIQSSKASAESVESELRDSRIVSVYEDGSTWIWDKDLQEDYPIATSALGGTGVKSSPCGSFIVTSDRAGLRVWDTASQNPVYEGKFSDQTKDFIVCSQSRSVFRLCQDFGEDFVEVWGPNCLSQFSVTHTWSEPEEAEGLLTRSSPESDYGPVVAFGVGARTSVQCSADRYGHLRLFDAGGEMTQDIKWKYRRVVRAITWSDNEECLAVADDTYRLDIFAVSRRQPWTMEKTCSKDLGDLPCQILFNKAGTSVLAAGNESAALWSYQSEALWPKHRIETSQRLHWVNLKEGNEELLLGFRPMTISIFRWEDLKCLAVLTLSPSNIPEPLTSVTERDQDNLVSDVVPSSDESQLLIRLSTRGSPGSLEVMLVEVSDINAAWHQQTESLKAVMYSPSLVKSVDVPLGLIIPEKCGRTRMQQTGSVLAFVDSTGWLCTLDAAGTLYEHSFLPLDWLDPRYLKLAKLAKDGTLFIPKQGSIAIVSNAFRKVVRESQLETDEDASASGDGPLHFTSPIHET